MVAGDRRQLALVWFVCWTVSCRSSDGDGSNDRAEALHRQGLLEESAVLVERGLARSPTTGPSRDRWLTLAAQIALDREVDTGPALTALRGHQPGDSLERARKQLVLARAALASGPAGECRKHLQAMRAELPSWQDSGLGSEALLVEARCQASAGETEQAEQIAASAVRLSRARGDKHWLAAAANTLGLIKLRRQRFDKALPLLREAASVAEQSGSRRIKCTALLNAGICLYSLGEYEAARVALAEAAQISRSLGAVAVEADILGEIGNSFHVERAFRRAAEEYQRALSRVKGREGSDAARFRLTFNLSRSLAGLGDWRRAATMVTEASSYATGPEAAFFRPYVRWHEGVIATGQGAHQRAASLFEEVIQLSGDTPTLRWQARADLARVHAARGDEKLAEELFQETLKDAETVRAGLSDVDHRISFVGTFIQFYDAYVESLISAGKVEQAAAVAVSSRGRLLAGSLGQPSEKWRTGNRLTRVARQVGANLVMFWVSGQRAIAWVVNGQGIHLVQLPHEQRLRELTLAYRDLIENSLQDPRRAIQHPARALYDELWVPIARHLDPGRPVFLSPDGPLHALPFPALVSPKGQYLIEEVQVAIAPAISLLPSDAVDWRVPASGAGRPALVIGDPVSVEADFPRLAHAGEELLSVQKRLGGEVTLLRDRAATAQAFADHARRHPRVIHFAAHALANETSPLDSTIVLSPGDRRKPAFRTRCSGHLAQRGPRNYFRLSQRRREVVRRRRPGWACLGLHERWSAKRCRGFVGRGRSLDT